MSLLDKIRAILKIKSFIKETQKEATKMADTPTGVKPGWKTTEFWLTILTNVGTLVGALNNVIPPEVAAIIMAVVNGLYGILRAIVKKPV